MSSLHSKQIGNNPRPLDATAIRTVVEAMRVSVGPAGGDLVERLS